MTHPNVSTQIIKISLSLLLSLFGLALIIVPVKASNICDAVTQIPKSECEALVALYNSTNGPNWIGSIWAEDWLTTNTPCNWYGVGCNAGHVTEIAIWHDRLKGSLPAKLSDLTKLQYLWLFDNELYGNIPPELGTLVNLQSIRLYDNQLSGNIPSQLGNLTSLQKLDLAGNQLNGNIPPQLGNLISLQKLNLAGNQLSGNIPFQIGNLVNLERLSLCYNQLNSNIPSQIGNLANLEQLCLSHNQLSGNIPPTIGNLANLFSFYMNSNQLSGNIPSEFGNLTSLKYLHLEDNQLSGIPPEFGNLNNLEQAYLQNNQLSGNIPSQLGNLSKIDLFHLNNNKLSGNIPPELGNLTTLDELYLANNQLSGNIPPELGNLRVRHLYLNNNQLSGKVPSELGDITSFFDRLYLSDNPLLTGPLPNNLINLTHLHTLYFNNTGLCEPIDASFQSWLDNIQFLESTNILCTPAVVIPLSGGSLTANDGSVTVQFPAGAVDFSTTITYTYYMKQLTGNLASMGRFFQLEASQNGNPITQFNKPITITVKYPTNHTLIKDTIHLYWFSQTTWMSDSISIISQTDTSLSSITDHFTLFGVLGKTNLVYLPIIMQ